MTRTAADSHHREPTLSGRRIAFTGKLASMSRRDAYELVRRAGAIPTGNVGPRTDTLVVGEAGWPLLADGGVSRKLYVAIRLNRQGQPLDILSETQWLARIGLMDEQSEVHRLYTPAMLARVLGVAIEDVRGWIRRRLIRPVRSVYRLQYFDFQEAAGAKRLAELVASGVPPEVIQQGLASLAGWLPGVERPLTQLKLLAEGNRLLLRHGDHLVEPSGQRRFDFEAPEPDQDTRDVAGTTALSAVTRTGTAAEWVATGQRLEEEANLAEAADAYRRALLLEGPNPETAFYLGHVLYRLGLMEAARERFHQAIECDPDYVEAWNNLGSVLAELGRLEEALDAYQCALAVHAEYADALYNLADTLEELGRHAEAVPYWKVYLRHDNRSSWAEEARRRLDDTSPPDRTTG